MKKVKNNLKQKKVMQSSSKEKSNSWFKRHPKIFTTLLVMGFIVSLSLFSVASNIYRNNQNKKLIERVTRDFPLLIQEIEEGTVYSLSKSHHCDDVTSKFQSTYFRCSLGARVKNMTDTTSREIYDVMHDSELVELGPRIENRNDFIFTISDDVSCDVGFSGDNSFFSMHCGLTIREANIPYSTSQFSEAVSE